VDSVHLMVEVRRQAERVAGLQERERIGIELHDGLLQTLGYLHLKADQAEAAAEMSGLTDLSRELGQYRKILEQASHGVRQFIAGLQELPPPPASLREALAQMIGELAGAPELGNTPAVTIEASGSDMVLSADQVVHLVLIAREALINAGRHGKAARATVRCNRIDGHGELLIEDNGIGFSLNDLPADGRPRFGLAVMRARAARVGAEFSMQSAPGRGTLVRARWLLEAPPATGDED